jgi:hypothetical protein
LKPLGSSGPALSAARADAPPGVLRTVEAGGDWGQDNVVALAFDASGARTLLVDSSDPWTNAWYSHLERRSAGGELRWERFGHYFSAAVSASGDVFVEVPPEPDDPAGASRFAKLGAADGEPQWEVAVRGPLLPLSGGGAIAFDSDYALLRRFGADGVEAAPVKSLCFGCGLTVTADDGLAILHSLQNGNSLLVKLGLDLVERWRTEVPGGAIRLVATADGGLAIAQPQAVAVLDGDGAVRFRRELPIEEWGNLGHLIAADPAGRIGLITTLGRWTGVHVLDATGEVAWSSVTDAALFPESIAFDPPGRLAVAGYHHETDFRGQHVVPNGPSDAFYLQFEP